MLFYRSCQFPFCSLARRPEKMQWWIAIRADGINGIWWFGGASSAGYNLKILSRVWLLKIADEMSISKKTSTGYLTCLADVLIRQIYEFVIQCKKKEKNYFVVLKVLTKANEIITNCFWIKKKYSFHFKTYSIII